ncbi:fimbrial biogenesis chaperone [Rubellimicrobium roseum]|uniref:Molecular chaperone n=1 Tax=Rubellimicrobium roseum TaxID=687525 RepID=A0A5C4NDD8_9RHOB|nr:fimbria/pilus periplasmic chaperone [Rubellimicrobium roseum]TNC71318.1 molecular chaperone [Rubellimicrobium roseum]
MRLRGYLLAAVIAGASLGAVPPRAAEAGALSISPTELLLPATGQTAFVTLRAAGREVIQGQIRIVRWTREGGQDAYAPTRDVVASPPAMRLAPNQEMTVRLVRRSNAPVRDRECYRVLIDQLPGAQEDGVAVQLTIRHSLPLCFG